jgi:hypothetical protein
MCNHMATRRTVCGSRSLFLLIVLLVFGGGVLDARYSWASRLLSSLSLQGASLWLIPAVTSITIGVNTNWHAPNATAINDLGQVLNRTGVYGYVFNTSETPPPQYGRYNWCNMPQVRRLEYEQAPGDYELAYLEIVWRCHG